MSVLGGDEETTYSNEEIIDDETSVQDQDPSDYRLIDVARDLQDALQDHSMAEELDLDCSDPENFIPYCVEETEREYDEFENFEKRIKGFENELKIFELGSKDSFHYVIIYWINYSMLENKEDFEFYQDKRKLTDVLGQ